MKTSWPVAFLLTWALPALAVAQTQAAGGSDESKKKPDPFACADFTWLTGNPRTKESPRSSCADPPSIAFSARCATRRCRWCLPAISPLGRGDVHAQPGREAQAAPRW